MGLAASQARLLTITARKSACEFQSMNISHQKLALSRSMENISTEYQNALNQTKLVYDYYGTGIDTMALTYNLLMSPSIYNDYFPKTLTDASNRIILDESIANAARAAGIPSEGYSATSSSDVRKKFINALADNNVISSATADIVNSTQYSNDIGLGSTIKTDTQTVDYTYDNPNDGDTLLSYIKANAYNLQVYMGGNTSLNGDKVYNIDKTEVDVPAETTYYNGSDTDRTSFSLYELLNEDITLGYDSIGGEFTPVFEAAALQNELLEGDYSIIKQIYDCFSSVLSGSDESDSALARAYDRIVSYFADDGALSDFTASIKSVLEDTDYSSWLNDYTMPNVQTNSKNYTSVGAEQFLYAMGTNLSSVKDSDFIDSADSYVGLIYTTSSKAYSKDDADITKCAISVSNLARAFLTEYVDALNDYRYDTGTDGADINNLYYTQVGNISTDNSLFTTDSAKNGNSTCTDYAADYTFTLVSTTELSEDDNLYPAFYDALFNQICVNGWVENDNIDDADYMTEMLRNGFIYISSISNDGYYYQGEYSTDTYISEVTDDSAITQAEAKYNAEKAKIENKEDSLDLKLKNLDTEISSLNQEYDTVKNTISKSIEKSFKRYEA